MERSMNLRGFLEWVEGEGRLLRVDSAVEPNVEMARIIHAVEDQPILFEDPCRAGWRVVSGVCADRTHFGWALGTDNMGIVPRLVEALDNPRQPAVIDGAPSPVPAEQSLQVMAILDGVYRSQAAGGEVAIE